MKTHLITRRSLLVGVSALAVAALVPVRASFGAETGDITIVHNIEPRSLVAALGGGTTESEHSVKVFDTLLDAGDSGLEPRLAGSWWSNPEGTEFGFALRDDIVWHDGTPFTAEDVAFTAMQIWKPMSGNVAFSRIETAEATDDHSVVLTMSEPVSPEFMMNSLGTHFGMVLPKHVYEGTDFRQNPANRAPIGTGPFRFKEWQAGQYLIYERNPDYYRAPLPMADRLIYRFEKSDANVAAVLESGQGDLAVRNAVPLRDIERLRQVPGLIVTDVGTEGAAINLQLEINMRREITSDLRVRQAMAHAIDIRSLIDIVFLGYGQALTGPLPNGSAFKNKAVQTYEFDPAKAEALLDDAGYPRGADGTRMTLDFVVASWYPTTRQSGDLIRQYLEDVGIKLNLITPDFAGTTTRLFADYDFDIALSNSLHFSDPGLTSFFTYWSEAIQPGVPFRNASGYSSDEMDDAIERSLSTSDLAERAAAIDLVQEIASRDIPVIPLVEAKQFTVYNSALQNVANNSRWSITSWENLSKTQ